MAREGSIVTLGSGRRAEVVRLLGEGGQGSVYEVAVDDGSRLALKWYHDHVATPQQQEVIADLIDRGAPNPRFLWPLELATDDRGHSFGYVMSIRPPRYVSLSALLNGAIDTTLRSVCGIGHQLADSFLMLHAQGLCYRDISFGNVFFDPESGDTLICDNDNVGIDGASTASVIGTKRFMAPEIVRREARPSTDTDLYSLSVLLFYLLMVGHPLLGARELEYQVWNEQAEARMFGAQPLFIFDPHDSSNRPLPDVHAAVLANWPIYPRALRDLFTTAFTTGLSDSHHGRIFDSEWRVELVKARDLLFSCSSCDATNFYDRDEPSRLCWHCGARLARPVTLAMPSGTVALGRDTEITAHHVGQTTYDFATVIARVVQNPARPEAWGLMNTSPHRWSVKLPDERRVDVDPGRSIGLISGSVLDFGRVTGRIEYTP